MTEKIFTEVKDILLDNGARFSTIAESVGQFAKVNDMYAGGIYFSVKHYCEIVRFVFDGSDEDFVNSIIEAFDKYTDLSKYSFVICGVPMSFSEEITAECQGISTGIINGLRNMTKAA